MIVQRVTWKVRPGYGKQFMDLLVAEARRAQSDLLRDWRVYQSSYGPVYAVVAEFDFADLATSERFWAGWITTPEAEAFAKQADPLVTADATNDVWTLVDRRTAASTAD
jgi:hypothetical protein